MRKGDKVIYLLHFPTPVNKAQHYMGITTRQNLRNRLRRHLAGFGAGLTTQAALTNEHIKLVAIWNCVPVTEERRLKDLGHLKRFCRLCTTHRGNQQKHIRHLNISLRATIKPQPVQLPLSISIP